MSEQGICRGSAIGSIADALDAGPDEMVVHAARRVAAERDRYRDALVEIDTYLANDPDVWRLSSVAKVGDVLCDVLGAETIHAINASVEPLLCPACGGVSTTPPTGETEKSR